MDSAGEVQYTYERTCYNCTRDGAIKTSTNNPPSAPTSTDANKSAAAQQTSSVSGTAKKKVGRPKGSTDEAKYAKADAEIKATNWVVEQHYNAREALLQDDTGRKQLPNGFLKNLVEEAKELWNLPDKFKVSRQAVSAREIRGRLKVNHRGTPSPMAPIEPTILQYCIAANRMNAPLDKPQVIQLANDLIRKTEHEARVREFKAKRAHVESADDIDQLVGEAWYRGFMRRHERVIKAKRKKTFAVNRANSTKYEDFVVMYDTMDNVVVKSGNGKWRDSPVFMDRNGETTEDETKALGHAVKVEVTDPDNIIYGDEVGSNTNMKDDGHIGGKLYIAPTDENANVLAAISDSHFTVIGFTSGSGKPVMVVIIFKAATVDPAWKDGLDIFSKEEGVGEGKIHPGGPTVEFKGVKVPVYCNCTESGSINSEILADAFKTMDDLKLFTRDANGKAPIAMLDGHCSRLGLPFLDYVCDKETKWYVLLGVPNQTQVWQLGDSSEQNGSFKMELYRWKLELLMRKRSVGGIPLSILKAEVAWGVRVACEVSFFRVQQNIRAMARRGLGFIMNRGCLDLPQVLRTASASVQAERNEVLACRGQPTSSLLPQRQPTASSQSVGAIADPSTLNLTAGVAGDITGLIFDEYQRQGGAEAHEKRKKEAAHARKNLKAHTRMTAGSVWSATDGGPLLGTALRDEQRRRHEIKKKEVAKKNKKAHEKRKKLKNEVDKIRRSAKYKRIASSSEWNSDKDLSALLHDRKKGLTNGDLKTLCSWFKVKEDGRIPTGKADLIRLFIKVRRRQEPILPQPDANPDTQDSDDGNEEEDTTTPGQAVSDETDIMEECEEEEAEADESDDESSHFYSEDDDDEDSDDAENDSDIGEEDEPTTQPKETRAERLQRRQGRRDN